MSNSIQRADVETLIRLAISEDSAEGDITSQAIFNMEKYIACNNRIKTAGCVLRFGYDPVCI